MTWRRSWTETSRKNCGSNVVSQRTWSVEGGSWVKILSSSKLLWSGRISHASCGDACCAWLTYSSTSSHVRNKGRQSLASTSTYTNHFSAVVGSTERTVKTGYRKSSSTGSMGPFPG